MTKKLDPLELIIKKYSGLRRKWRIRKVIGEEQ